MTKIFQHMEKTERDNMREIARSRGQTQKEQHPTNTSYREQPAVPSARPQRGKALGLELASALVGVTDDPNTVPYQGCKGSRRRKKQP